MAKNDNKYTDPELRSEIKEDVQASDKGGQPGQWSARKAQMVASEYKKSMHERDEEPYTTDKSEQSESQKHLSEWTKEEWQTSEGKAEAKQVDGTEQRYLPKKAWENMPDDEKKATNEKKLKGSKEGKQYVHNTEAAKEARRDAQDRSEDTEAGEGDGNANNDHESTNEEDQKSHELAGEPAPERSAKHKRTDSEEDDDTSKALPAAKAVKGSHGEKRTTRSRDKGGSQLRSDAETKRNENDGVSNGSDGGAGLGEPGSATRLPEEGRKVHWKAPSGWCEGSVLEILYSEKNVNGRRAKASEGDPRIVLKSTKSGKQAVHKPEAIHF